MSKTGGHVCPGRGEEGVRLWRHCNAICYKRVLRPHAYLLVHLTRRRRPSNFSPLDLCHDAWKEHSRCTMSQQYYCMGCPHMHTYLPLCKRVDCQFRHVTAQQCGGAYVAVLSERIDFILRWDCSPPSTNNDLFVSLYTRVVCIDISMLHEFKYRISLLTMVLI